MKYIYLLQNGQRDEAIIYARTHFLLFGFKKLGGTSVFYLFWNNL